MRLFQREDAAIWLIVPVLLGILSAPAIAISNDRVFAYAAANYPAIFRGTPTAGQFQQYDYRYYPASGNYLAVDTGGVISMLGPYTGNIVTIVGPVSAFEAAITAWEAAHAPAATPVQACGPAAPSTAVAEFFTASPIDPDAIRWITPLGNLNPPAHSLPTDHIYFYFANPDAGESAVARRTAFFAPADGTVAFVFHNSASLPDTKIFVSVSETLLYYLDHLIPEIPISPGTRLSAGQRLGTTGSSYGIDLGVINSTLTLGFVNPARYANSDTLHADAPLKYYAEPLRSRLYGKVQRIGPDCDGRIDYDVAGRLSGNWYVEFGTAPLAFAYDTYDPTQVRISTPNLLAQSGVFAIAPADPLPRDVSVASGKVRYTLTPARTGPPFQASPSGRMLVQMLDDARIRVEIFPLSGGAEEFTANARVYVR